MLPKANLGTFHDRLCLSFVLRLSILLSIATFRPFSDCIHLVITASICCAFCLVSLALLVFNLNWRPFRQNREYLLSNPSLFTPYPCVSMIFLLVAFSAGYFLNSSHFNGRNVWVSVFLYREM